MTGLSRRTFLAAAAVAPLATAARAATHQVRIEGFKFVPENLTVAVGDKVVFTNADGAPHTATARNGAFDTGRLRRNDSAEVTISAAGQIEYFCAIHPRMTGTIVAG